MFGQVKKILIVTMCAVFVLAMAGLTMAAEEDKPDTPTELKGGTIINTAEAKALVDKKDASFFDFRSAINYGKGHLPGAVSVPYKGKSTNTADFDASLDEFDMSKLPQDKEAKIVFYSDGPKGWKSYKAAVTLIKAGYKNVMWYREGSDTWIAKDYPIER